MKKVLALILASTFIFVGCAQVVNPEETNEVVDLTTVDETLLETEETVTVTETNFVELENVVDYDSFSSLQDPDLLYYVADNVYATLDNELDDDFNIEGISTRYLSEEYITELEYNSLENIYFGYTLSEIQAEFGDVTYVYTVGDDGSTTVVPVGPRDTTFNQIVRNVAIGTGVILVCVTVSMVTGGTASIVFATAASTALEYAGSCAAISGIAKGLMTGIQTGDFDQAIRAGALAASEGFMVGAISGAVVGAALGGLQAYSAAAASPVRPSPRDSELYALSGYYPDGVEQVTYLNGEIVPYGTQYASRPDIVIGDVAVEVKNYNLTTNIENLADKLIEQVASRNQNLPSNMTQEIFLDARGQGLSLERMNEVVSYLQGRLLDVYPNIPIQFVY